MIVEKIRQKKQPLGIDPTMAKYFYFSEAPDDETDSESNEGSEEVSAETKPIKIRKPSVNYAKDIPSVEDDDELPPPPGEETPTPEEDAAAIAEDDPPEPVAVDANDIAADDDPVEDTEDELPPPPGEEAPTEEPATDEPSDDTENLPPPPGEEDAEQPAEANETDDLPPPPGEEAPAEEPASVDEPSENDENLPPPPGEEGSGDTVTVDTPADDDSSELPPPPGEEGSEPSADGEGSEDLPPPPGEEGDSGDDEIDDELGLLEDENPEDPTDASGPTRKYNLYRDFLALYNANKGYIEKLEHSRPDSLEATTVINSVLDKLRKVDSSMSEYMIIRFADAPYLQSLLFFQQLIATIRLCFSLIRNNKPFIDQTAHIEDLIKPNRKSNNKH